MARQPRFVLPGQPHLVMQRGHGGHALFVDDIDAARYLELLRSSSREQRVSVHAFAIRSHRVELLLTPSDAAGLSKLMQGLARGYALHLNERHARAGTPWLGRFCSAPIDPDTCFLDAMRLVEASETDEVIASSRAHHLGMALHPWLLDHSAFWRIGNTPFERESSYAALLDSPWPPAVAQKMRAAVVNGWPLGSPAYLAQLAQSTKRPVVPALRGRPPRVAKSVPN